MTHQLTDAGLDAILDYQRPRGWYRSTKGNLTRVWNGLRLSVFGFKDGGFSWCLADGKDSLFAPCVYESEQEAVNAVVEIVEG